MSEHDDEVQERPSPAPAARPKPLKVEPVDHGYVEKDANSQDIETHYVRADEEK